MLDVVRWLNAKRYETSAVKTGELCFVVDLEGAVDEPDCGCSSTVVVVVVAMVNNDQSMTGQKKQKGNGTSHKTSKRVLRAVLD